MGCPCLNITFGALSVLKPFKWNRKWSGEGEEMVVQTGQIAEAAKVPEQTDLRWMKEEQFIELFEYLKERTSGFKRIPQELLIENNQYLFVFRMCFGLTRDEFARELAVSKEWVRHTEAGRNVILHEKIADRYIGKLNALMNRREINARRALENFSRYRYHADDQNLPEPQARFKPLMEMSSDDFREYFDLVSKETKGFIKFNPDLLVRIPQSILIFRITLGIDHRKFAILLGIDRRHLRRYEHLDARIKPRTAAGLMKKIEQLFKGFEVKFEDVISNFYRFKHLFQRRSLNVCIENGLRLAKKIPPNELENKFRVLLERLEIPYEFHARISGTKRDYNVDFAIPNARDPKIIIEVTAPTLFHSSTNYRFNICWLDHKFQVIKAKHPSVLTVMVLIPKGIPTDLQRVREMIRAETLNTDMYAVDEEEAKNLIIKVKEITIKF